MERGAEIDAGSNEEECTPLYAASHEGHVECVKLLIKHGATNHPDYQQTPLLRAAFARPHPALSLIVVDRDHELLLRVLTTNAKSLPALTPQTKAHFLNLACSTSPPENKPMCPTTLDLVQLMITAHEHTERSTSQATLQDLISLGIQPWTMHAFHFSRPSFQAAVIAFIIAVTGDKEKTMPLPRLNMDVVGVVLSFCGRAWFE